MREGIFESEDEARELLKVIESKCDNTDCVVVGEVVVDCVECKLKMCKEMNLIKKPELEAAEDEVKNMFKKNYHAVAENIVMHYIDLAKKEIEKLKENNIENY